MYASLRSFVVQFRIVSLILVFKVQDLGGIIISRQVHRALMVKLLARGMDEILIVNPVQIKVVKKWTVKTREVEGWVEGQAMVLVVILNQ
jgi:hypothetical protein